MVSRSKGTTKRRREWDPNASDSNDEDYNEEEAAVPRSARKTTKATPRGKKGGKPKSRSARKKNSWSDDDEELDEDDEEVIGGGNSEDDIEESEDEDVPMNRAGRSTRRAAAKVHNYQESDPDDIKELEEEPTKEDKPAVKSKSQIIRLKIGGALPGAPATPPMPRRTTRATSKEPTTVPPTAPRPTSSAGRSIRATSVGASTRAARTTRQTSAGPGVKGRQGSAEPGNPPGRRSSRLHPDVDAEESELSKGLPKHPSTVEEEDEEIFDPAAMPKAGEITKAAIETSTEAVYGGSRETFERDDADQDAPGEADEDDELPTQRSRSNKNNSQNQPSTPPPRGSPRKGRAPSTVSPTKFRKSPFKDRSQPTLEIPQQTRRGGSRGGSQTRGSDDDDWKMDEDGSDDDSDDMSGSDGSPGKTSGKPFIVDDDGEEYSEPGRRTRGKGSQGGGVSKRKRNVASEDDDLQGELADLQDSPGTRRSKRRAAAKADSQPRKPQLRERTAKVDYRIINPEFQVFGDDMLQTPIIGPGGFGGAKKQASVPTLYGTSGPFGGWGSATPIFGRTPFMGPAADSDSSDDDEAQRKRGVGDTGAILGHSTAGVAQPALLPPTAFLNPPATDVPVGPSNLGGPPSGGKKATTDSDPLGVDQSVSFDSVGGHEEHIRQLREMVALPLMYPEIFQEFGISPPKGVLFHGPPGTGKTLMARALASSCSTQTGKKVTFYMRKGADCLSKWVGEAERQLRLLFEEAKNSQPSIIFFDEIDGLAPVRSAKQDQIHASIVSTLLALMDGMDGRGQVIVIGATNRPDSVDPALRRPGRFDREFYFPLPDVDGRLKIIDIHTKNWNPPLSEDFKRELAVQTKGFGGADIRGMCTEAALNAVQRVYPQLYTSWDKYIIDAKKIQVVAADFLKAMKKIVPSSERSTSSGAQPLPKHIQPLLEGPLNGIKAVIKKLFPERKRLTVFEEAMYEDDPDPVRGFEREKMMANFENARIFRPRLLIHGPPGMGQQYLSGALLHHFEGFHVQLLDMATLQSDSLVVSPESSLIQKFVEVKRHKPSIIFIPNIDTWYSTMSPQVVSTFTALLRSIPPNDPIMLVGTAEATVEDLQNHYPQLLSDLFSYTKLNRYKLERPDRNTRIAYFKPLASHLKKSPREYPDPANRPKRVLEVLEKAPPSPPHQPTPEEIAAQTKRDGQIRNWLRIGLMGWIEQSKQRYKKLKKPIIDHQALVNLGKEPEPPAAEEVTSDIPLPVRKPYDLTTDKHGHPMILEVETGKKYYNIDVDIVEIRISNGYYCLPRQFLEDIKLIAIDAQTFGSDKERILRANEMVANAEVFVTDLETKDPNWLADCERLYQRQLEKQRVKDTRKAAREARKAAESAPVIEANASGVGSNGISNGDSPRKPGSPTKFESPSKASHSAGIPDLLNPETPSKPAHVSDSNNTSLSNGISHDDNSNQQSTEAQDMEMGNTNSSNGSFATSAFHTAPPSSQPTFGPGVGSTTAGKMNIGTILREGSPNTSRISSSSNRTSGGGSALTQSTNGGRYSIGSTQGAATPSFQEFDGISSADSQLPDTQVLSSSESGGQASQAYPMHGSQPLPSQMDSYSPHLFGSVPPNLKMGEFKTPDAKEIIIDLFAVDQLPSEIAGKTDGFSVEQLEQANTALMEAIWAGRNEWNRNKVLGKVKHTLSEVLKDIRAMQAILPGSFDLSEGDSYSLEHED